MDQRNSATLWQRDFALATALQSPPAWLIQRSRRRTNCQRGSAPRPYHAGRHLPLPLGSCQRFQTAAPDHTLPRQPLEWLAVEQPSASRGSEAKSRAHLGPKPRWDPG